MLKFNWKAVTVAAVLVMTVPALLALAADKTPKPAPASKSAGQAMPGCSMHGGEAAEAPAGMPGCAMKGGKGMAGCCTPAEMKACGMKGGKDMAGCCSPAEMKACGMKGGKGMACTPAEMKACGMKGGKGMACVSGDMKGCGMKGGRGMACVSGDMKGCGMKGGRGMVCVSGDMKGCGMKGGKGMACVSGDMKGCGMKGGMGLGMPCGPGMGPQMGAGPGPMMLHGLDLTADQQKKVAAIHERAQRQMIRQQADLRLATMDLQQLMRADKPEQAKIDAQIDRLAQLRAGMQKSRAATMLEVHALLTPEQLKKVQSGPLGGEDEEDD